MSTFTRRRAYPPSSFPARFAYTLDELRPHGSTPDTVFYSFPRLVNHIDDKAIAELGKYYDAVLDGSVRVLDVCSSWVSHVPQDRAKGMEMTGIGMNLHELENNPLLKHRIVHDLNQEPDVLIALEKNGLTNEHPYDVVICNVSIDYLSDPLTVLGSIAKVLKEGGWVHLAISNRCFPTKVVRPWLNLSTSSRLDLVASYFHFADTPYPDQGDGDIKPAQLFDEIETMDLVSEGCGSDPLWIVRARKRTETESL
ncbi:hypothetical protein BCR39DRAFT_467752 [Naematelia encephala]|uniref:Methyltransferase type 11 domain-containing protein n=1 Tax=Naematelia encephala TaxID=71784 RepID=A0A1Y2B2D4_9TREE|nr:hypothetical protein BCR39DRAFT_467752 [Naematelia encephala]